MPTCPQCGANIEPTWDWCHACGFDPEKKKPVFWQPGAARSSDAAPSYGPLPPSPATPSSPSPLPFAPAGYRGAGTQPPGFATGPYAPSPPPSSASSSWLVRTLVLAAAVVILLPIIAIATVTLLGKEESKKFESPAVAIQAPVPTVKTTEVWQPHTPADSAFTASFPCPGSAIVESTEPTDPHPEITLTGTRRVSCRAGSDTTYEVWHADLKPEVVASDSRALDIFERSVTPPFKGATRDDAPFAGMPSRHRTWQSQSPDGRPVFGHLRLVLAGRRVYALLSDARDPAFQHFDQFEGGFHINS